MCRTDLAVPHREALPAACSDFVGSYTFSMFVTTLSSNGIVSSRLINPKGRARRSLVLLDTEQSFCGLWGWPCHALRPVPKRPPSRRTTQLPVPGTPRLPSSRLPRRPRAPLVRPPVEMLWSVGRAPVPAEHTSARVLSPSQSLIA